MGPPKKWTPWKWTWKWTPNPMEVDTPEVNMEVDLPGSGCRRGGGRGPAEKYCWASGWYALEKRLPCQCWFQGLSLMWEEEITNRIWNRIFTKDRFKTQYYAACFCEYVPILNMGDKKCQSSDLHQILTPHSPDPVLSVQVVPPSCGDAIGTPWWPTLLHFKHIPKAPGVLCQNFIKIDPAVMKLCYMTVLKDCYLQWPQNTLHTPSAMPPPDPVDPTNPMVAVTAIIMKLLPNQLNFAHETILWLVHHRTIWWFPAVS